MKSVFKVEVAYSSMNEFSLYERLRNAVFEWQTTEPKVKTVTVLPLKSKELIAQPITKQGRLEDSSQIAARMRELASEPCKAGFVPISTETLNEWARQLLPC
jgi:hypothetical protein